MTRTCTERSGFSIRGSFISDLHQWSLGRDCSEGREESQQMDSNQRGASCQSASQHAACLPVAADRVQDCRQCEVQHYCGASHGTDQNVLNRAKRLIPGQGTGVWRGRRRLGSKREEGGGAGGDEPAEVRFRRLLCCGWGHEQLPVCGYVTNSL